MDAEISDTAYRDLDSRREVGLQEEQEQSSRPQRPRVFRGKHFRQRRWTWVYDTDF